VSFRTTGAVADPPGQEAGLDDQVGTSNTHQQAFPRQETDDDRRGLSSDRVLWDLCEELLATIKLIFRRKMVKEGRCSVGPFQLPRASLELLRRLLKAAQTGERIEEVRQTQAFQEMIRQADLTAWVQRAGIQGTLLPSAPSQLSLLRAAHIALGLPTNQIARADQLIGNQGFRSLRVFGAQAAGRTGWQDVQDALWRLRDHKARFGHPPPKIHLLKIDAGDGLEDSERPVPQRPEGNYGVVVATSDGHGTALLPPIEEDPRPALAQMEYLRTLCKMVEEGQPGSSHEETFWSASEVGEQRS
jgi:hypothetical protein